MRQNHQLTATHSRSAAFVRVLVMSLCGAGLLLAGCASSGGPAATAADAAPAAPAKKAFEAPEWAAEVFESEEHGFSLHYPADFAEAPAQGGLFAAASPSQVPRVDIIVLPMDPASTEMSAAAAALEENMKQVGGGEAKVTASKGVTLKDEVTEAMEFTLEWTFQGFPLESLIVGAPSGSGEGIVAIMVTGMQGGDPAELADIAYTLYFD